MSEQFLQRVHKYAHLLGMKARPIMFIIWHSFLRLPRVCMHDPLKRLYAVIVYKFRLDFSFLVATMYHSNKKNFCAPPTPFLQERRESGIARNRQNATVENLRQMIAIPPPLYTVYCASLLLLLTLRFKRA